MSELIDEWFDRDSIKWGCKMYSFGRFRLEHPSIVLYVGCSNLYHSKTFCMDEFSSKEELIKCAINEIGRVQPVFSGYQKGEISLKSAKNILKHEIKHKVKEEYDNNSVNYIAISGLFAFISVICLLALLNI